MVTQKEHLDLCTICHDGMECENIILHAKYWNTKDNWKTREVTSESAMKKFNKEVDELEEYFKENDTR